MNTINTELVRLTTDDVKDLQYLSIKTFYDTFLWGNTEENLKMFFDSVFSQEKLTEEIKNPETEFYFVKHENRPIGYIKVNYGQAQTELCEDKGFELERIYVLQEFQGKKVGQLLFDKALQLAREKNKEYLWLGVWEKNPKAIKFYERNGFVQFDTHIYIVGDDPQTDIMMKLML